MTGPIETAAEALGGSLKDFRDPQGVDLVERTEPFFAWQDARRRSDLWSYSRSSQAAPGTSCEARDDAGRPISGVNFGSQDYLSLSSHPAVKAAAKAAIDEYGVHSAGSSALLGNTGLSLRLEAAFSEFLNGRQIVLYPTGWAAGFGAVQGLVRANDHVLMDVLAHSCLQEGARAATSNIHFHGHLNLDSAERKLRQIREKDSENGILVVTESLFSMHSDTPDLVRLKRICETWGATLLVDCAHDLGAIGEDGLGNLGLQNMVEAADVIVAAFSKTFASNGGFVSVRTRAAKEYLKYYSATQTFSNALSPVQAAIVLESLAIIRSEEGRRLRAALMRNVNFLRGEIQAAGMTALGNPSAIVPVHVGSEDVARLATRALGAKGVIANLVEYPAVPRGNARFRLQVMAKHRAEDITTLVRQMRGAVDEAEQMKQGWGGGIAAEVAA